MMYGKPRPGMRLSAWLAARDMQREFSGNPFPTYTEGLFAGNPGAFNHRLLQANPTGHENQQNPYAYAGYDLVRSFNPNAGFGQAAYDPTEEKRIRETRAVNKDGSVTVTRQTTTIGVVDGRQTGIGRVRYRTRESAAGAPARVSDDMESRLLTLSEMQGGALVEVTSGKRTSQQQYDITDGDSDSGPHVLNDAADIKISGKTPVQATDAAWNSGLFNSVAEYDPAAGGHIHVDQKKRGGKSRRYKTDRDGKRVYRIDERE